MATSFTIADTSELISMALSDKVTFNDIKAKFNIDESEVKKIMKRELKHTSYLAWRKRVSRRRDKNQKSGTSLYYVKSSIKNLGYDKLVL